MKKRVIKIIAYENGGDMTQCLFSIDEHDPDAEVRLFCPYDGMDKQRALRDTCGKLLDAGKIHSYELFHSPAVGDIETVANNIAARWNNSGKENSFLFFLSSSVLLSSSALSRLAEMLSAHDDIGGLNPVFTAGWDESGRVAHMGTVCDCQKHLHYLYEGLPLNNPLAKKTRFFQFAHPAAIMLREADFFAINGLNASFDYLAWPDFCLRLLKLRNAGFSSTPNIRAVLLDKFDSWMACGTWNSVMQRGRLNATGIAADYPAVVAADNLEYRIDDWLNEFPRDPGYDCEPGSPWESMIAWRHNPCPDSFFRFIAQLSDNDKKYALKLTATLPFSLPRLFGYYLAQCDKIFRIAHESQLTELEAQCANWRKKSLRFHHGQLKPGMRALQKAGIYNSSLDRCPSVFDAYVELGENWRELKIGPEWPKIAVLMPVYNPRPEFLIQAIDSTRAQKYGNWELCIADDASTNPEIAEILRASARDDGRINVVFREKNGHICHASNTALELVSAPWTAFLDHDDMLSSQALGMVAEKLAEREELGYIYSDEDHIDETNVRRGPFFRPDFDNDFLNTGHLSSYSTELLRDIGGFRPGLDGSQDFDLELRATARLAPENIAHIPHILYHWRVHEDSTTACIAAKPYAVEATKRALLDYANRSGRAARVVKTERNYQYRLEYILQPNTRCAVILLADRHFPGPAPELCSCLNALGQKIKVKLYWQSFGEEILAVPESVKNSGASILPHVRGGWAQAANAALCRIDSPTLLFLYAGLRPLPMCEPGQLIVQASRKDLAMAGGLVWRDDRLVNGGWYPDITGYPFLLLRHIPRPLTISFSWGEMLMAKHTLGFSWQCMALNRENLEEDIFLNEQYGELSLVDFSLRQAQKGRNTLVTPSGQWETGRPEMYPTNRDFSTIHEKWGEAIKSSGLRNPNLRATADNDWTIIL